MEVTIHEILAAREWRAEKQKELLRQFEAESTGKEYEGRKSFMDRVKELFT